MKKIRKRNQAKENKWLRDVKLQTTDMSSRKLYDKSLWKKWIKQIFNKPRFKFVTLNYWEWGESVVVQISEKAKLCMRRKRKTNKFVRLERDERAESGINVISLKPQFLKNNEA